MERLNPAFQAILWGCLMRLVHSVSSWGGGGGVGAVKMGRLGSIHKAGDWPSLSGSQNKPPDQLNPVFHQSGPRGSTIG